MAKVIAGFFAALIVIPLVVVLGAVVSLVLAWPIMLLLGAAASVSGYGFLAVGYWTTFWLTWAVRIAVAATSNVSK